MFKMTDVIDFENISTILNAIQKENSKIRKMIKSGWVLVSMFVRILVFFFLPGDQVSFDFLKGRAMNDESNELGT